MLRIEAELDRRGYPNADVDISTFDTDNPLNVVVSVEVRAGPPRVVVDRWFGVWPNPNVPGLAERSETTRSTWATASTPRRSTRPTASSARCSRSRGFHDAEVGHRVERRPTGALLRVDVRAGPLQKLVFEGNRHFDAAALESALELEDNEDREPGLLADRLRAFYVERGFLDAEVRTERRGASDAAVRALAFVIRERRPVRVVAREYPCLSGESTPADVGSGIDSFLSELPGSDLVGAVNENVVNNLYGPGAPRGSRPPPYSPSPWTTYVPEVYDKAIEHLRDLFRSKGYLSATVGPPAIVRRACDPNSPAGRCIPIGPRRRPRTECRYDEVGLPVEEPPLDPALTCRPIPSVGCRASRKPCFTFPSSSVRGRFSTTWRSRGTARSSSGISRRLQPCRWVSRSRPSSSKRRGAAWSTPTPKRASPLPKSKPISIFRFDHTRGRVRFVIGERDRVRVARIDVRGARATNESLIRRRIALEVGGLYRRSLARLTQERLGQLGVFSSVGVGFEDPYVPAREKVVVVTVVESVPQYVETPDPDSSRARGFASRSNTDTETWRAKRSRSRCTVSSATCRARSFSSPTCVRTTTSST